MSNTLYFVLDGPMQSWGDESYLNARRTREQPTKSGVVGLCASALGRERKDPIGDLANLRFSVRIDREGKVLSDFHTARAGYKDKYLYTTKRYYLHDAVFLIGLTSNDRTLLETVQHALLWPENILFTGRKSCIRNPKVLGIFDGDFRKTMYDIPWNGYGTMPDKLRIFVETDITEHGSVPVFDYPISFDSKKRKYGYYFAKEEFISTDPFKNHDAFKLLEEE